MVRSMMFFKNVKLMFWGDAVKCAAYLRNRSPSNALDNKTPHEIGLAISLQLGISEFLVPPAMP